MPSAPLTERQNQAYEAILAYFREHNKPPTLKELGDLLAIRSTNGVSKHLAALEAKGYIRRLPHEARGIALADGAADPYAFDADVPSLLLVSRTNSAKPDALRKRPKGALYTDPELLGDADEDDCLVGRAGDDGLSGLGILKGDYLVIEERSWRRLDRDTVVAALVGDKLLARRFALVDKRIHLTPANRTYSAESFELRDPGCHVIGPVRSVMRKL